MAAPHPTNPKPLHSILGVRGIAAYQEQRRIGTLDRTGMSKHAARMGITPPTMRAGDCAGSDLVCEIPCYPSVGGAADLARP